MTSPDPHFKTRVVLNLALGSLSAIDQYRRVTTEAPAARRSLRASTAAAATLTAVRVFDAEAAPTSSAQTRNRLRRRAAATALCAAVPALSSRLLLGNRPHVSRRRAVAHALLVAGSGFAARMIAPRPVSKATRR